MTHALEDGTYLLIPGGWGHPVHWADGYSVGIESLYVGPPLSKPMFWDLLGYDASGYVGVWTDSTGLQYVDRVTKILDLSEALRLANFRGELAVWDNAHGKEIRVEYA